ncbi:MAG: tRNA1(Val) (adenine(37)-N6)-methyltransferase [Eubacteriales bacterium]|nr:tRNA1(Val) (adenine(37)-N6)-methyltransferase [Eubacteriales bacterium]
MERIDSIGFGGMKLEQGDGFRFGVDAILLAAFTAGETGGKGVKQKSSLNGIELGCGNGVISLVLSHKIPTSRITGVEVQAEEAQRAKSNVERNHLQDRIEIVHSDILDFIQDREKERDSYDFVVTNPPYFKRGGAIPSDSSGKYIARHETSADLDGFLQVSAELLNRRGELFMVHRPDRLVDICTSMRKHRIEPKELQLVAPYPGKGANILLVHGIRNAGAELQMLPTIYVRNESKEYSEMIDRIYERGDSDN